MTPILLSYASLKGISTGHFCPSSPHVDAATLLIRTHIFA